MEEKGPNDAQPCGRVVSLPSQHRFEETWLRLTHTIETDKQLTLVAHVDRPAGRLLLFEHVELSAQLAQISAEAGLTLPFKIQLYEEPSGQVMLMYEDPVEATSTLKIDEARGDALLTRIAEILRSVSASATRTQKR